MTGTQFFAARRHGFEAGAQAVALGQRQAQGHDGGKGQQGGQRRGQERLVEKYVENSNAQHVSLTS